ncbi:MAG: mechanosensitive ion channel family protein, partial [Steroidobacteraceae bacterium]|nr:mechanosensitive ion channel family protein [Steroidobacteraceae bacterium]MDW8258536.1 mechanosensitive ion channel family protein [Gammaproteobacteria bacterium]
NLGVNITALVAGLGVGGIALALAVQTVLGDILASLSITLDQPFVVGDLLRIDDIEGTVERIGIKSTRLRSVTGEQIALSNADILKSRLRNLGRMADRRVLFTLGIAYETPLERLETLPRIVAQAVKNTADTRFEHCLLRGFGESALQFEVIYYVLRGAAARLPRIQDEVNFRILRACHEHGIRFAYPTRTLHVHEERVN